MLTRFLSCGVILVVLLHAGSIYSEDVIFEDKFEDGLSSKWKIEGLKKEDYRIKHGALEVRVQPGKPGAKTPAIRFILPANAPNDVSASVKVTVLDPFTKDGEEAGINLSDDSGLEFGAKKERVDSLLVFSPPEYVFRGKPGEEGDDKKYDRKYALESPKDGPLRIIVRSKYAYFQVGPHETDKDKYLNPFHSAINDKVKGRGFSLVATGAPNKAEHWVRFDDFQVVGH